MILMSGFVAGSWPGVATALGVVAARCFSGLRLREMTLVALPLDRRRPSNSASRKLGLCGTAPTTYGRPFSVVAGFHCLDLFVEFIVQ